MIMSHIFDWIFDQYQGQPTHLVVLELIGVLFGFLSVWYAKKNNIWVYPTGIISTAVFVYILWHYGLLGDMIINAYYFSMSIYGWYIWTRKVDATHYTPITKTSSGEWKWSWILFVATLIFIYVVYNWFDKWNNWTAYTDAITTAILFCRDVAYG